MEIGRPSTDYIYTHTGQGHDMCVHETHQPCLNTFGPHVTLHLTGITHMSEPVQKGEELEHKHIGTQANDR